MQVEPTCAAGPEDHDGFEDQDACADPDNDRDGILDVDDRCPDDPEDLDAFEDEDGCPDMDNDGDRIADIDDQCPDDPETYNGNEDEDGCPDTGCGHPWDPGPIVILDKVFFPDRRAEVPAASRPILDAIAAALQANPSITRVEIQGHTDARGSDAYNIRASRAQAAAILEALVARGVERARLRSAGYGERCPLDPGTTREAFARNRRVEFRILEDEGVPRAEAITCPAAQELVPEP